MSLRIEPATPERWSDVEGAFGRWASKPDSCWCQRFRHHDDPSNHHALRAEISTASVPIGLLAYDDGRPVGSTRAVPRATLSGITANNAIQRVAEGDDSAYAYPVTPPKSTDAYIASLDDRAGAEQPKRIDQDAEPHIPLAGEASVPELEVDENVAPRPEEEIADVARAEPDTTDRGHPEN